MKRGKKYSEAAKLVDKAMLYDTADAIDLVQKTSTTKFDATVEAHIRLGVDSRHADQQVRGAVVHTAQAKQFVFWYSRRATRLKRLLQPARIS